MMRLRNIEVAQMTLSSDAKCNTPRRFGIGVVDQDLRECCDASLFAPVGRRKRPDWRDDGGGAFRASGNRAFRIGSSLYTACAILIPAAAMRSGRNTLTVDPLAKFNARVIFPVPPGPAFRMRPTASSCAHSHDAWLFPNDLQAIGVERSMPDVSP